MASPKEFKRVLLTNGSTTNAIGDYSGAPETFEYVVPGGIFMATRLAVTVAFTGKTDVTYYGPIPTLINGIIIQIVTADGVACSLTAKTPIKTNLDLGVYATDGSHIQSDATPERNDQAFVGVSLNFAELMGLYPVERQSGGLKMSAGARVQVILNDDFSANNIIAHEFELAGRMMNA